MGEQEITTERDRAQRERELSSLYATARSLTALGDLGDVLQSIVRHAHDLIGTDFTYLSLVGPDGGLSITASEGTVSPAFRAARIPQGTGLGGKVVDSRSAHFVSRYADAELQHHPAFDALVGDEGLVALLGVPLLVRGEAIGVLFAADRAERTFRADEIALLSAFADHAAVALDNARLYAESRATTTQIQEAYRTIEDQVSAMERAQRAHEALTGVVLTSGGPEEVARRLVDQLGGSVTVLDRDGVAVAVVGEGAEELAVATAADPSLVAATEDAVRAGRCVTTSAPAGGSRSVAPIQGGNALLGTIVWAQPREPGPIDNRTLELAAHVVALLVLTENAAADAEERLRGELLTELMLAGPDTSATQRARARTRGVDVDALGLLLLVDADETSRDELMRRLRVVARERDGLAGEHQGRATLLLPAGEPVAAAAAELHQRLRRELGAPLVVMADRGGAQSWTHAYSRAHRCLAVARALDLVDDGLAAEDLALYAMVFDPERSDDLTAFLVETIGPLVDYDRKRATDLVGTLDAYFRHGANLSRTAREIHVHVNTLLKRLDRSVAVLGHDWRTGDDLPLRMAVRLQVLRGAVSAHS